MTPFGYMQQYKFHVHVIFITRYTIAETFNTNTIKMLFCESNAMLPAYKIIIRNQETKVLMFRLLLFK